jgi:hypothetical protein
VFSAASCEIVTSSVIPDSVSMTLSGRETDKFCQTVSIFIFSIKPRIRRHNSRSENASTRFSCVPILASLFTIRS